MDDPINNDHQSFLLAAVHSRNIHRFRLALLLSGASPDRPDDEDETLTIFEKCCQTPGYSEFVRECIRWGCDVNKVNKLTEKRAINYAVESQDVDNIRAILEDPTRNALDDDIISTSRSNSIASDDMTSDDGTKSPSRKGSDDEGSALGRMQEQTMSPLHQLANNLNADNFESIFQCIKEMIDRHANVNVSDKSRSPPLLIIAKSNIPVEKKEHIIKYFLDNSAVDLDSYRDGETRYILNAQYPHLRLPEPQTEKRGWDFMRLITALRDGEEKEFLCGLRIFLSQHSAPTTTSGDDAGGGGGDDDDDESVSNLFRERLFNETLLMVAAKNGFARAAEKMLRCGADVNNYQTRKTSSMMLATTKFGDLDDLAAAKLPIELACMYGNWQVLELFLKCANISLGETPLLVNIVKNIGEPGYTKSCDYKKCFYLLLNYAKTDVNQSDATGCTALHAAVRYNNQAEILALLHKGAYIGSQNKYNDLPITDIDAKILEAHFNSCISTNGRRAGDDNYEIRFDYSNLVPIIVRDTAAAAAAASSTTSTGDHQPAIAQCTDEMGPIEYMSKSTELKHLVKHPLIASFLFLKWHQLALVFYTNFICYTVYCLAMIFYLLFCYGQEKPNKGISAILYLITVLGTLYVLGREIAQLVMSPKVYVRNKENYLEIVLIGTTIVVLTNFEFTESTRKTVAAFTILMAVTEFFLLTGSLPVLSFSTHLVMLKTVAKSFMKGLLLYSIILIAFALCFYTLLGDVKREPAADGGVVDEIADFNNFVHPGVAIVKAVVMLTGEFDASNIHFTQNTASYLLFVIFVFLISTVLQNLLNGLAVSDTQAIKSEAELMNFIYRAKLMARYEKILLGKGENVCCNFLLQKWSSSMMNVFPEFLPLNMLTVLPNANNQVVIPITAPGDLKRHQQQQQQSLEDGITNYRQLEGTVRALNCCFGIRCSSMEVKIVKYAKHVLDIKDRDVKEHKEKEVMQQRIINIETSIDQMSGKLELVVEKLTMQTT